MRFPFTGFVLVRVVVFGFVGLGLFCDGIREFSHVLDFSFYAAKFMDQRLESAVLFQDQHDYLGCDAVR